MVSGNKFTKITNKLQNEGNKSKQKIKNSKLNQLQNERLTFFLMNLYKLN